MCLPPSACHFLICPLFLSHLSPPSLPPSSFPIRVCWVIQPTNASLPLKSSSDFKCNVSHIYTCHTVFSICSSYEMSFSEKGRYKVDAKFINRVSCVNASYTFQVVAGEWTEVYRQAFKAVSHFPKKKEPELP